MTALRFTLLTLAIIGASVLSEQAVQAKRIALPRRFTFEFKPDTPLQDLLPAPPKTPLPAPGLGDDLALVPELMFGEPFSKEEKDTEKAMAHVIAKINHVSQKDPDAFMKALVASRADLRGLPFRMGKDCRTDEKPATLFAEIVRLTHNEVAQVRNGVIETVVTKQMTPDQTLLAATLFERIEQQLAAAKSNKDSLMSKAAAADVERTVVAALTQIFIPGDESEIVEPKIAVSFRTEPNRIELAKFLARIEQPEAGRALAQLALFAPEEAVRAAAIDAMKSRKARDYPKALVQGFRYPLPVVAKRAADALIKTNSKETLADLVNVLEQPDPRLPAKQTIDGEEVVAMREIVRVNHHRNCVLCHAPANVRGVPATVLSVGVALPNHPLQSGGYGFGDSPDIFVRTDVTYLRQDFSMRLKVENAKPWPEMQRFDFFVRTRVLTTDEAATITKTLADKTPAQHAAANLALRQLTGQEPQVASAAEWRKLLNLPEQ